MHSQQIGEEIIPDVGSGWLNIASTTVGECVSPLRKASGL